MQGTTDYLQAGFLLISAANLVVILLLFVVFFVAISFRLNRDDSITIVDRAENHQATAPPRDLNG